MKNALKTGAYVAPTVFALATPVFHGGAVSPPAPISGTITQVCNTAGSGPTIFVSINLALTGITPNLPFTIVLVLLSQGMALPGVLPLTVFVNGVTNGAGNATAVATNATFYRSIPPTLIADTIRVNVLPPGADPSIGAPLYTTLITPQNMLCS